MDAEVTFLTRRGNAVMRKANRISADSVRFGRGTFNEVPLLDLRVEMAAAALSYRGRRLTIEQLGAAPVRVKDKPIAEPTRVGRGDEVWIGPYRIELIEPPEGCDVAMTVELVRPLGDALGRLVVNSRLNLQASDLNKRISSWTAFALLVLLCLVLPAAFFWGGLIMPWSKTAPQRVDTGAVVAMSSNIGQMSNSHRFFAANCSTCHESAFTAVRDQACLSCHQDVGAHIRKAADVGPLRGRADTMRCTHCHVEHRGVRSLVIRNVGLCAECHNSLAEVAPNDDVRDVVGFPKGHPQFRATVVADPVVPRFERVQVDRKEPPADRPGLKFSHAAHLVAGGFPALGYKQMACADCHKPEPAGRGFLPVTYKGQCAGCHEHELVFAKLDLPWPKAAVPHGDDAGIVAAVWNYYAGQALQRGLPAASARAEVAAKAEAALRGVILDDKRGCAYCHYGTAPQGAFDLAAVIPTSLQAQPPSSAAPAHFIAPVRLQSRFLPRAVFDHSSHAAMQCGDCHRRRDAESRRSLVTLGAAELAATVPEPLDIPGIENCVECHGHERATLRAGSTCVTCHVFHRSGIGVMRERAAASK